MFEKIDLNDFWDKDSVYDDLKSEPFSEETLRDIEKQLGYKFPQSYIALMRIQNGGRPKNTSVGCTGYEIERIYGISKDTDYIFFDLKDLVPVCSMICDDEPILLDYRKCGSDGEPRVVTIDLQDDTISFIAKDFESFINMLDPASDDDDEDDGSVFDPYEGIQFTPVEGEQRKELKRAIWGALPWGIGFTAFWLLVIFLCFLSNNVIVVLIRILSFFPAGYGLLGTVACLTDCISKSKKTYESYVDTVDAVWEVNEPRVKAKDDGKKRMIFLRLKNSKAESYRNTEGFKEGDRIRVYRPKTKKGEEILVKEPDTPLTEAHD